MSASTLREALDVAVRFTPLVTTALSMRLSRHGDIAALTIDTHDDMGSARDIATLSLLIGLWQIGNALTGRELTGRVDIAMPEPSYWSRLSHLVSTARFEQPTTQVVFAASELLDRERCERALLMLSAAHYSIDDIAQRLSFSTPPNFVRALRRWMGTTPAAYRRGRLT